MSWINQTASSADEHVDWHRLLGALACGRPSSPSSPSSLSGHGLSPGWASSEVAVVQWCSPDTRSQFAVRSADAACGLVRNALGSPRKLPA